MPSNGSKNVKTKPRLGFLTVLDHGPQGLFGGYLITNMAGRPIEFHCTSPIKPNRAQEILYGPTLQPYLYGEQIGQTLLGKATVKPVLVCTDRQTALCVRQFVDTPVALVIAAEEALESVSERQLEEFHLGRNHLAVPERSPGERGAITESLAELGESFDLAEPFGRIREAIEEARRGGR